MDRINKFLNKRPAKNKKIIKYNNKEYEVNKKILRDVRAFRSRKCLDPEFKLSRPLDLSFTRSVAEEPIEKRENKNRHEEMVRKLQDHYRSNPLVERPKINKNEIVDLWEDETLEDLENYIQEWKYSIKDAYDRPLAECATTKEHLEDEIRRVYLQYFKPRETKNKSIAELLPRLPNATALRPFPERKAMEWCIAGSCAVQPRAYSSANHSNNENYKENNKNEINGKRCATTLSSAFSKNKCEIWDLKYGKFITEISTDEKILKTQINKNGEMMVLTRYKVYIYSGRTFENGTAVVESVDRIKDAFINEDRLAVLVGNIARVYDMRSSECIETIEIKKSSCNNIRIEDGATIVSTANGLVKAVGNTSEGRTDVKILDCVVDFAGWRNKILVINNLSRLFVLEEDMAVKRTLKLAGVGKSIKAHPLLNMFAVLLDHSVEIYKYVDRDYVPAHVIEGRHEMIEWDGEMPWLYIGDGDKISLYS
ncbi:hypothetical protein ENBRE01_2247 [Enteropsectra breve]|nr:hypothetical protein ENBRE01_2247 [Enteropsectra breve]